MTSIELFRFRLAHLYDRTPVRRCAGLAILAAALCLQPGCTTDYASSDPAFPGDFQTRHQIVLASAPTRMDVYPAGGTLDARTVADLRSFANRYRALGSGEVAIVIAGRTASAAHAVNEIRAVLRNSGLRGRIRVGSYVPYDSESAAPIRVAFMGLKAEVKTPCGLWPEDLASGSSLEGWRNEPYYNFGCATQSVVAAQVDDPARFCSSADPGPLRRRYAHAGDRGRSQRPGSGHRMVDQAYADWRERSMTGGVHEDAATDSPYRIEPIPRVSIHAFCETDETAAVIEAAATDRRLAKAHVQNAMGGAAAAIEAYQNAPTPNVIVLEASLEKGDLIERLDALAQLCDAGTKVVVLGRTNDILLYRQLVARGVNEYLVAPVHIVDFLRAISELFRAPGAKPLGRLIGVVGAKGGAGSSTVAHNLAGSLASVTEMATIVADCDLAFGTAALNFNQDPPQGVADAVFDPDRVDATLVDRVLSKCGDHLSLLAAPAVLDRVLDFSETSFDTLLDALRAAAPWSVLDVPHLWSGWVRRILVAADEVIVVANPDLANLRNTKNLIDFLKGARPHDHPPRLVLNAVGMMKRPEIATAEFAKTVDMAPAAVFAHDAKLFGSAANNGQMIADIEPKGKAAQTFLSLASAVAGRQEKAKSRKGFFNPLIGKLVGVRS